MRLHCICLQRAASVGSTALLSTGAHADRKHCVRCAGKEEAESLAVMIRRRKGPVVAPPQDITCTDILLAMEAHPEGITPSLLAAHMAAQRATTDSASDAGSFVVV